MPNKNELLLSIHHDLIADESFYKRVYGYSVTDSAFPAMVANKLIESGRKEVVQGYNEWLQQYLKEDRESKKEAAEWLQQEIDRDYDRRVKEREWEQKESNQKKKAERWTKFGKMLNFK